MYLATQSSLKHVGKITCHIRNAGSQEFKPWDTEGKKEHLTEASPRQRLSIITTDKHKVVISEINTDRKPCKCSGKT